MSKEQKKALESHEVQRYSRQLLLPGVGVQGQLRLCDARALIVGVGGLGCPVAMYLAGGGVGTIGLVDIPGEVVEVSNLHRQIAHTTKGAELRIPKTDSARSTIESLNPNVNVIVHEEFESRNAVEICNGYDIVLDCTDNVRARYLVNDACAVTRTTLVHGAALGTDGTLTVLCGNAPCYRCIFPEAPPPACVGSCDAAGVLGPLTGVIGSLMALEAMKILADMKGKETLAGKMMFFDGLRAEFRPVKLGRGKKKGCFACGEVGGLNVATYDYVRFVNGGPVEDKKTTLEEEYRISVEELDRIRKEEMDVELVDCRPKVQFDMCSLEGFKNVPLDSMNEEVVKEMAGIGKKMVVLCRRGNKSQTATRLLLDAGKLNVVDVRGGLQAWHKQIDNEFPLY